MQANDVWVILYKNSKNADFYTYKFSENFNFVTEYTYIIQSALKNGLYRVKHA